MGRKIEMNWYLVCGGDHPFKDLGDGSFEVVKEEERIYPIEAPLPFIIKKKGCVGMATVKSFTVSNNKTVITFTLDTDYDKNILAHYNAMYLMMKQAK